MIAFRTNEWRKAVDYKAVAVGQCCVKHSKRFCIAQIVFPKWAHKCPSTIGITFWNLIFFDAVAYRSSHCYEAPTILAERVRHLPLFSLFYVEVCARNQQFTLIEIALERYPPGPPTQCWNPLTVKYLPPEYQHCPGVEGDALKRSVFEKVRNCIGRFGLNVAS